MDKVDEVLEASVEVRLRAHLHYLGEVREIHVGVDAEQSVVEKVGKKGGRGGEERGGDWEDWIVVRDRRDCQKK